MNAGRCRCALRFDLGRRAAQGSQHGVAGGVHPRRSLDLSETFPGRRSSGCRRRPRRFPCAGCTVSPGRLAHQPVRQSRERRRTVEQHVHPAHAQRSVARRPSRRAAAQTPPQTLRWPAPPGLPFPSAGGTDRRSNAPAPPSPSRRASRAVRPATCARRDAPTQPPPPARRCRRLPRHTSNVIGHGG